MSNQEHHQNGWRRKVLSINHFDNKVHLEGFTSLSLTDLVQHQHDKTLVGIQLKNSSCEKDHNKKACSHAEHIVKNLMKNK